MSLQHIGKGALRVAKNYTKRYSDAKVKVRGATSNDPWGPSGTQMNEIAQLTYNQNDFIEIMEMLDKRLNDKGKNWRHVFKALTLLDYCLQVGSENVVIYFRDNIYLLKILKEFQYIDEDGRDQGANVRQKAKDITNLLQDESRLRQERRSRASIRDRMSDPASTNQSVERGLTSSLKGGSGGSASAMDLEVLSMGIGGSGSVNGHQHFVDRSDIKTTQSQSVAEDYVHGEPLPQLIDAIPQRTEGRVPIQRKLAIEEEGILALAISDPGDDADFDKVYGLNTSASEDQEEKLAPTLETLMQTRIPLDLTGQVEVSDYRRPAHGGLAVVYPGLWNDRPVAVKLLKFQKDGGADAYWDVSNERRVRREINVWAALRHPNITEFLGYSTDLADFPAMISRWCERGTVLEHLKREALSVNQRMKLAQDVSRGLEYLHQLKVVHGDVKPGNILVDDEGLAKLCDFGLVRLVDWDGPAGMTTTSPYTGTERYKAPELFVTAENRRPVATFAGDTYSLGCIMLELIERIYPFQRFTRTYDLRDAIMDGHAPALRSETTHALTDLTEFFWNLLEACWAKRAERPSITVIVDALDIYARTIPGSP